METVDHAVEGALLLRRILDQVRRAEAHGRAVVDRMVEAAARQHQAVEMRHRQADRHAGLLTKQHAAELAAFAYRK